MTDTYTYDVFGALRSTTGTTANPFDFAGQQTDHTANRGLQYLRARHYDPALGRFLGRDPVPFAQRYAYAGDDPVNAADPSGRCHDAQRYAHPASATPVATGTPFPTAAPVAPEKPPREKRFDACSPPVHFAWSDPFIFDAAVAYWGFFNNIGTRLREYADSDRGSGCLSAVYGEIRFFAEQRLTDVAFPYLPWWQDIGDIPQYVGNRLHTIDACSPR